MIKSIIVVNKSPSDLLFSNICRQNYGDNYLFAINKTTNLSRYILFIFVNGKDLI